MDETASAKDSHTSAANKAPGKLWRLFAFLTDWPAMLLIVVLLIAAGVWWWLNRDVVPRHVVIAAGPREQAYERAGVALEYALARNGLHASVAHVSDLAGSPQNAEALRSSAMAEDEDGASYPVQANIGIVQPRELARPGDDSEKLVAVAPLFHAKVFVAVKRALLDDAVGGADQFAATRPGNAEYQFAVAKVLREQLAGGLHVDATRAGSGTALAAEMIERHYCSGMEGPAEQLADDEVTVRIRHTAWLDEGLLNRLRTNEYELVSIDAGAFAQQPQYEIVTIPAGAYGYDQRGERIPRHEITTVASTDFVAVRADAPDALVTTVLDAIYGDPLGFAASLNEPTAQSTRPPIQLIPQTEILSQHLNSSFHPAAQAYYQPFDPSELASWAEFLAGSKDLLVAFAAGVFLLYGLRVRMERRAEQQRISEEKEVLDEYLEKTIELEGEQWNCRDPEKLERILAAITAIKIEALHKLSHEDLRSDRAFSIFLMQCANVINKIQMKILAFRGEEPGKAVVDNHGTNDSK